MRPVLRSIARPKFVVVFEVVAEIIGGLNLATIGRAAATLGVRERVVLPGVTASGEGCA